MAFEPAFGNVMALAVALAMVGLAFFLLAIAFSSRLHQALALLLVCQAVYLGLVGFGARTTDLAERYRIYFMLAIPVVAVCFAAVYVGRHVGGRRRTVRATVLAAVAAGAALQVAYLRDHGIVVDGSLQVAYALPSLAFAAVTVVLLFHYRHSPEGRLRQSLFLAALGFSLQPVYESSFHVMGPVGERIWGVDHGHGGDPWLFASDALRIVPIAALAVAAGVLLRPGAGGSPGRRRALASFWVLAAVAGIADAAAFQTMDDPRLWAQVHRLANAVWTLVGLAFIAYAMVRHHLFDVDLPARGAIRQSTLVSVFLATFFVGTVTAENFLTSRYGWAVGGAVAGLLLFALAPLQRAADRLSSWTTPGADPAGLGKAQRLALYEEQLRMAWSDGSLTRRERLRFDALRARLGLDAQEAAALEHEVLVGPARRHRRSGAAAGSE